MYVPALRADVVQVALPLAIAWLSQPDSAFWGVVFVGVWKYFPFVVVIVLARLQVIPQDLYEAADLLVKEKLQDRMRDVAKKLHPEATTRPAPSPTTREGS